LAGNQEKQESGKNEAKIVDLWPGPNSFFSTYDVWSDFENAGTLPKHKDLF
jgi:hypothetical protein